MQRPQRGECGDYYFRYIDLVPDGDVLEFLEQQLTELSELLGGISEEKSTYRYAEGKWSIKELVGHINDTERVFTGRALWFARNNPGPLPGMEQDDFVEFGDFDQRSMANLAEEFSIIRTSSLMLLRNLTDEAWRRSGSAYGNPLTVHSIAWLLAGHVIHHERILKERYL